MKANAMLAAAGLLLIADSAAAQGAWAGDPCGWAIRNNYRGRCTPAGRFKMKAPNGTYTVLFPNGGVARNLSFSDAQINSGLDADNLDAGGEAEDEDAEIDRAIGPQ